MRRALAPGILALALATHLSAVETERLYLSGTEPDDAVEWEFSIDQGRRSGSWSTIPVPSQWELQGFGEFSYGRHDEVRAETGSYRTRFTVPNRWRERRLWLVFEGVMTDLEARLNGERVGAPHLGGFTRFSYEVTDLVRFDGGENLLEMEVSEASRDRSVNLAERDADYWVFGGIFRPVLLEALPATAVTHLAIDARHDGTMRVEVEVSPDTVEVELAGRVIDAAGGVVGSLGQVGRDQGSEHRVLSGSLPGIVPWSAERPNLYQLEVEIAKRGEVVHRVRQRFGFRTVEVRPEDGLFVNGRRVLLKGINRHSFWPTSGRTLTRAQNRRDVELIKELNANAVRTSHYPPDRAFLEACDELGLYVIDELPGWHDAYQTVVGRDLAHEMVRRDVNHPSVILWANGNEGGWNVLVESVFRRHDPQRRPVIHPQSVWGGFDTVHYPSFEELRRTLAGEGLANWLRSWLQPRPLVMPTEMLHGLYDGGLGAGLGEFWQLIRSSSRGAGGFLWALLDEGVVRADRGGEIDTYGNYAPDGLVGPFREKEASFATVRKVWSPVALKSSRLGSTTLELFFENRFVETDLADCRFRWRWLRWPGPGPAAEVEVLASAGAVGPAAGPGEAGVVSVALAEGADALEITARDPAGRAVETWVVEVADRSELIDRWLGAERAGEGRSVDALSARAALGLESAEPAPDQEAERWTGYPSGWFRLESDLREDGLVLPGVIEEIEDVAWLGRGPDPVWRNRREGPRLGFWAPPGGPGFFDDVVWARMPDGDGALYLVVESTTLFVGLSAPRFAEDARFARAEVPPPGSLALLPSIPAIGTKFHPPEDLAPPDSESAVGGTTSAVVWLRRGAR